MSNTRSSDLSMVPLSYAVDKVSPASIGFSPSLESTEAIFGVIRSPLLATTESLATQMLPPSILVWTLISPNSLITGPGGSCYDRIVLQQSLKLGYCLFLPRCYFSGRRHWLMPPLSGVSLLVVPLRL